VDPSQVISWYVGGSSKISFSQTSLARRTFFISVHIVSPKRVANLLIEHQGLRNVFRNLDAELASSYPILGTNFFSETLVESAT
jgi:hypothetical protein